MLPQTSPNPPPCPPTDSQLPAPPATSSPCPSNYVTWYKNCYRLVSEPKTWEEAEAACVKEGGHLASVDMSYDQAFISGAIQQGNTDAWIGLRRKWSDGWPVFYTHWGPGEPTNHKGEGCVSMHGRSHFIQGTWNDTACEKITQNPHQLNLLSACEGQ
uniref:C-type lectin domain-containing protein n=1 Tax=Pygocentrus nattereri TaxID=42514 RepID=A0AAR2KAQ9_PYGNA